MKRLFLFVVMIVLAFPAVALAQPAQPTLPLSSDAFWSMVLGAVTPGSAYLINRLWPKASEALKGSVLLLVSAAVGAAYKAIQSGLDFGQLSTWETIGLAVAAAFFAHHGVWKPLGLSDRLRGPNVPRSTRAHVEIHNHS